MRDSVSFWNSTAPTTQSNARLGKPKANRVEDFARFLPLWPQEVADRSFEGRKKLITVLERALREERRRGRRGDGAYDLARHAALNRILKEERVALSALQMQALAAQAGAGLPRHDVSGGRHTANVSGRTGSGPPTKS
jgi:hypothetical protein